MYMVPTPLGGRPQSTKPEYIVEGNASFHPGSEVTTDREEPEIQYKNNNKHKCYTCHQRREKHAISTYVICWFFPYPFHVHRECSTVGMQL